MRVVNTLLENLDARKNIGITIAITNHEGLLDPAVWRRFEKPHIRIELPDLATRLEMITKFSAPIEGRQATLQKVLAFVVGEASGSRLRTFTDTLKRVIAMQGALVNPQTVVAATKSLMPRLGLGHDKNSPAALLMNDQNGFIGAAVHEFGLSIKQERLAQMLCCHQSTISRAASEWLSRHGPPPTESAYAQ